MRLMKYGASRMRLWARKGMPALVLLLLLGAVPRGNAEPPVQREVVSGIMTDRALPGEPYDLAGNRVVFTDWYYIQPGDLDWRDSTGKSVYVHGDSDLYDATHVGINAPRGIRIAAQKPIVKGPMDLPYRTIMRHDGKYKGWTASEYCESEDGFTWTKTPLVLGPGHVDGVIHVFVDPVAPAEERFKSVWGDRITRAQFDEFRARRPDGWEPRALLLLGEKDEISCLRGSVSPDGIHWTALPDPLVVEYSDTHNTCYYDTALEKYVLYTRYWSVGPRTDTLPPDIRGAWTGVGRRAIGRSESADFRAFPPSTMILEPTPDMLPSEALYTNCRTTVPGAPDQYLMFPTIWNASIDDTTRIAMASSHDSVVWHWTPDGEILETGPFGQWNGGCIWVFPELIELSNGDWALPYIGHNVPHKYPRGKHVGGGGYAVWEKGRMVAVQADDAGEFTMMPIVAPGTMLKVNVLTDRVGSVTVEVVGKDGRSFGDCAPVVGDRHWTTVSWGGAVDIGVEKGKPVTLRFRLIQAKLFGIEFE